MPLHVSRFPCHFRILEEKWRRSLLLWLYLLPHTNACQRQLQSVSDFARIKGESGEAFLTNANLWGNTGPTSSVNLDALVQIIVRLGKWKIEKRSREANVSTTVECCPNCAESSDSFCDFGEYPVQSLAWLVQHRHLKCMT